ncbi:MAG: hypothetical protein BGO76_02440, partial [Caedibacter sp. 38-128]
MNFPGYTTPINPLYVHTFATNGTFQQPSSIAVDPISGRVFISDTTAGKVYHYETTGINKTTFFDELTSLPLGLTTSIRMVGNEKRSSLWMTKTQSGNANGYKIVQYDLSNALTPANGAVPLTISTSTYTSPSAIAALKQPNEVASKIYLTTPGNEIKVYDTINNNVNPSILLNAGELATGLSVNSSTGDIYAALRDQGKVKVIGSSIFYLPAADMALPSGVATINIPNFSPVWVADSDNHNIQYYRNDTIPPNYQLKGQIDGNGLDSPTALALNEYTGKIYVLDPVANESISILFAPEAWVQPGRSILQKLTLDRNLTLNDGRSLRVSTTDDANIPIGGTGEFTVTNNAQLSLPSTMGQPLEADSFIIEGGAKLSLDGGSLETGSLLLDGGKILVNQGTTLSTTNIASDITIDSASTFSIAPVTFTLSTPLKGAGGLRVESSNITQGKLKLSADNSNFSGAMEVNEATVLIGSNTKPLGTGPVTLRSNAILTFEADATLQNNFFIGVLGNFNTLSNSVTSKGILTGTIKENGASTMHVWGDLTTEGNVEVSLIGIKDNSKLTTKGPFIQAPSIGIGGNSILDIQYLNALYPSQTVKDLSGSPVTSKVILGDKTLILNSNINSDYKGTIEGSNIAKLVKAGTNDLTLYANGYGGETRIESGSIIAKTNTSFGTSKVTLLNDTALQFGDINLALGNPIVLDPGNSVNPGATIDSGGFASTLSGAITQIGASVMKLIIKGGNILTLGGVTSHQGGTEVQDNMTLKAGVANVISGDLNLSGQNAIFDLNSYSSTLRRLSGQGTVTNTLANSTSTLTLQPTANNIFSGNIQDGVGKIAVTLNSPGVTQNFSGNNTYSAGTVVQDITLKLGSAGALPQGRDVTIDVNGTLDLSIYSQTIKKLMGSGTITSNSGDPTILSTLTLTPDADTTFSGNIQDGTGKVATVINSPGVTQTFSGNNTYSGGTRAQAGTIVASNNSALGTGVVSLEGGTLQAGQNPLTLGNNIALGNSSIIDNKGYELTFSGNFSSSTQGILEFIDSSVAQNGTTILSGQSIFSNKMITQKTRLTNSGAMTLNNSTTLGSDNLFTNTGTITINASTFNNRDMCINSEEITNNHNFNNFDILRLDTNSKFTGTGSLNLSGSTVIFNGPGIQFNNNIALNPDFIDLLENTLSVANGVTQNINNVISSPNGSAPLIKDGLGTLVLSGANTYEGGTKIQNGTLSISSDSNLGKAYHPTTAPDAIVTLGTNTGLNDTSGTLKFTAGFALNRPITLNQGGGIFDIGNNPVTLSGVISGNGSLTKTGVGILYLNAQNLHSGGTTISSGAVQVGHNSALGTGPVTMAGGTTLFWGADANLSNAFTLNGITNLNTSSHVGTLSGILSGQGGLNILDNLNLGTIGGAANTYSGNTTIAAGKTVTVYKLGALGTGNVTMADNTTLKFAASATIANPITLNGNTATINTGGFASTLGGAISQAVGTITNLIIKGGNILTLGSVTSHNGSTEVQAGTTLKAGIPNIFGGSNKSLSLVGAGATFDMSLGSQILSDLNGDDNTTINLGGSTLTFGTGNDSTFKSVIKGVGGKVVKQGTGTWFVSNQNTYSGGTAVENGTVAIIDNPAAQLGTGSVTMKDGTTLKWGVVNTLNNDFILNTVANNAVGITLDGTTTNGGLAGVISGPGKLVVTGEIRLGSTTQSSPNTYSGGTYITPNSTVAIFKNGALGTGTSTFGNNTTLSWGADGTLSNPFTLNGTVMMESGGYLGTINGPINGGGKLIANGEFSLNGQNSFTGGLELNNYTSVFFSTDTALGDGSVTMADSTFLYWGANTTVGNRFILNAPTTGPHQGTTFDTGTFLSTLTGVIEGTNKLLLRGSGTLISKTQNLLTGGIELYDNVTFALGSGGSLPNNSDVTLADNGTIFDISLAAPVSLRRMNGHSNSRVILGDNTLTLNQNSTFNGTFNSNA